MAAAGFNSFPPEFGWVLLTLFYSIIAHNIYMAFKVSAARKKYGVQYPYLYAPPGHKHEHQFNCIQRGHQNSLEMLPTFYALLIVDALRWPLLTAILGAIYVTGRILYFDGYSTGDPKARYRGSVQYLGMLPLQIMPLVWAAQLLL